MNCFRFFTVSTVSRNRLKARAISFCKKEFDTVTENMTEGIILLNASGTVLGINRTATQLLGVGQACIGRHILSVSCSAELSELLRKAEKGLHAEKRINLGDNRYQMLLSPVISGGVRAVGN